MDDGGVLAAPSGIHFIDFKDLTSVPTNGRCIAVACGGTNWIFAEIKKESNEQMSVGKSFARVIPEAERQKEAYSIAHPI